LGRFGGIVTVDANRCLRGFSSPRPLKRTPGWKSTLYNFTSFNSKDARRRPIVTSQHPDFPLLLRRAPLAALDGFPMLCLAGP